MEIFLDNQRAPFFWKNSKINDQFASANSLLLKWKQTRRQTHRNSQTKNVTGLKSSETNSGLLQACKFFIRLLLDTSDYFCNIKFPETVSRFHRLILTS